MKLSEAWQILAEEHDARRSGSGFLCLALQNIYGEWSGQMATIPYLTRQAMKARIRADLHGRGVAYMCIEDGRFMAPSEARAARVLACLMFAEEAKSAERASARRAAK